jgi:hypothetical protein
MPLMSDVWTMYPPEGTPMEFSFTALVSERAARDYARQAISNMRDGRVRRLPAGTKFRPEEHVVTHYPDFEGSQLEGF